MPICVCNMCIVVPHTQMYACAWLTKYMYTHMYNMYMIFP